MGPALLIAAALSFPTAAAEPCTSLYRYEAVETPLKVSPALTVRLRNPYGSRVNIGRSFVQFRIVYASTAERAKVAAVTWALDGVPGAYKRGSGRDAYLFASFHLTPGPHVVTAAISPAGGGPPVTGEIHFTATRCEPLSFSATADNRKAPGAQPSVFGFYSGATPLRRVEIGARGALVSTGARLRGRKVGELRLVIGSKLDASALRLPDHWSDPRAIPLLEDGAVRVTLDPASRRFVRVTGLPDGVGNLELSFGGPRRFGQGPSETPTGPPTGAPGLVGTRARCQAITWESWARGADGPTVHATSKQSGRAFRACQRARGSGR